MRKLSATDYPAFYQMYMDKVPDGNILQSLSDQLTDALSFLGGISEEDSGYSYEEKKWSIKEVVGHLIDSERIFAYRALRIARNDKTPLSGFDEDQYVSEANFRARFFQSLIEEFEMVRRANILMFNHFNDVECLRSGIANGQKITVLALGYISVGHVAHHFEIIRTRYLQR